MSFKRACSAQNYNIFFKKSSKYFIVLPQALDMILIQEWAGDIAEVVYRVLYAFKARYCYKSNSDFITISHSQIQARIPKKSIETIKRGLRRLEQEGWIEIVQRGSKHLPNKFRLSLPEHLLDKLNIELFEDTILSPAIRETEIKAEPVVHKIAKPLSLIEPTQAIPEPAPLSSTIEKALPQALTHNTQLDVSIPEKDLKLWERHKTLFQEYQTQNLDILEVAKKVRAAFTAHELEIIYATDARMQQKKQIYNKGRSNLINETIKFDPPSNNNIKNNIVKLTKQKSVTRKIHLSQKEELDIQREIRNMKALGNIRGSSALKSLEEVIEEVKFHVSRYGGTCILKALNGAKKLLRHGKWETPIALKYHRLNETKLREYNVQIEKQDQMMAANDFIDNVTNMLTAKRG